MSVAFAAEIVIAHKGVTTVALTREEEREKETEGKKSTEEMCSTFYDPMLSEPPALRNIPTPLFKQAPLPEGHQHTPFNPPDAL